MTALSSETIHASSVAIGGRAVLISGPSGSGKSDLALRLIDRGAKLISDDYTMVVRSGEKLVASAPSTIRGKIEIRGLGIVEIANVETVPVAMIIRLGQAIERLPESQNEYILGASIPVVALSAFEASAPIKVEFSLKALMT